MYIYIKEGDAPPWSINHRDLAYHYTAYINIYTYIEEEDEPPWSIDHRCLPYHYTTYIYRKDMNPPGQSITEALHTTTLLIYISI